MPRIINLANVTQFQATSLSDGGYLPGPRIIPGAVQVVINWSLTDGKIGHNVLYAAYSGTPALSVAVAEQIRAGIASGAQWTALAAFLASTTALTSVTILDIRSAVGTAFQSSGAAAPGTSASPALPDEMALVVTLRTSTRGQAGRGRMYVPGYASNAQGAAGIVVAGAVTATQAWASQVYSSIGSAIGGMSLGHFARQAYTSPTTGRQFPARPAALLPITLLPVRDNHWDSQRRRGLK